MDCARPGGPPLLLAALYVTITPLGLPATPLVIAGGMVFGPLLGSLYNTVGLLIAAMAGFFFAGALGREFVVRIAGQRLRRAERVFARQGFWPLVQIRFLPIPFSMVSYGAALAGGQGAAVLVDLGHWSDPGDRDPHLFRSLP